MDTTQVIILTMIVNIIMSGLVGGVVIYTVQKKIDAAIQKSLFEYQTKFVRSQEKSVETLEGAYQRFLVFTDAVYATIREISNSIQPDLMTEEKELAKKHDDLFDKINDFWHYCAVNRLFLPDNIMQEIKKILEKAFGIETTVIMLLRSPDLGLALPSDWADSLARMLDLDARGKQIETPELFLSELRRELERHTKTLERLYKSMADAQ